MLLVGQRLHISHDHHLIRSWGIRHAKQFDVDEVLYHHGVKKLLVGYLCRAGLASDQQRTRKPLPRYAAPPAADHGPKGPHAAHAATPRRLGTPAAVPNRGAGPRCGVPHSPGGLGSSTATLCCASRTVPPAEPIPETNPNAIRSTASEVVGAPGYRY